MANVQPLPEICCLKNSNISVYVEEALLDFLIVSYEYDSKLYQGVLLDASKRTLPCGISAPSGYPDDSTLHGLGADEDKMHNVAQRHSYFQDKSALHSGPVSKDAVPLGSAYHMRRTMRGVQSKFKSSRMTVRLRPRQVLCSKCKSICNENSENVDFSKRQRGVGSTTVSSCPTEKKSCMPRQVSPKSPRPPFSENPQENKSSSNLSISRSKSQTNTSGDTSSLRPSLIPKTVKESEVSLNSTVNKLILEGGFWTKVSSECDVGSETNKNANNTLLQASGDVLPADSSNDLSISSVDVCESEKSFDVMKPSSPELDVVGISNDSVCTRSDPQTNLSSKLSDSFASSETDESQDRMVLRKKRNIGSMEDLWDETVFLEDTTRRTTPVIKISFGTQGEGTVLKIPSKVRSYPGSDSDAEDNKVEELVPVKHKAKAAKKAHKKAKKEARRKEVPEDDLGMSSRPINANSPVYDAKHLFQRRHKRKVKHKKRDKGIYDQHDVTPIIDESDLDIQPLMQEDPLKIDDLPCDDLSVSNIFENYDSMKEKCLKHKLSINLKRLNSSLYSQCSDPSASGGSDSSTCYFDLPGTDDLPDFPKPPKEHDFMTVATCLTSDGRTMEIGDVVWGKIHGFPWWPGKVLSITIKRKGDGTSCTPQAHVAWYGSSTSSLMPCDQLSPFLETFKIRFNRKKRGPYKEAIRQATLEARQGSNDTEQEIDVVS